MSAALIILVQIMPVAVSLDIVEYRKTTAENVVNLEIVFHSNSDGAQVKRQICNEMRE